MQGAQSGDLYKAKPILVYMSLNKDRPASWCSALYCWMTEDLRTTLGFYPWKSESLLQNSWWRDPNLTEGSMLTMLTTPLWMNLLTTRRPAGRSGPRWSAPSVMTRWTECPTSTSIATQAVWVDTGLCDRPCRSSTKCFRRWAHVAYVLFVCFWFPLNSLHTFLPSLGMCVLHLTFTTKVGFFFACFCPCVPNSSRWLCHCRLRSTPVQHSPFAQVQDSKECKMRYFTVV